MTTAFITCHFNPVGFSRSEANWRKFRKTWNYPVLSIEAFWDEPKTDSEILIKATNNQIMWQKERLLNLLIESLPSEFDVICWLDADIEIKNLDIVALEKAVKKNPVVQLFQSITLLDEFGGVEGKFTGIAANACGVPKLGRHAKEGYAWAIRRDVIDDIGLYDASILGAGDTYMWNAWVGHWGAWPRPIMTRGIAEHYYDWAWKIYQRVRGRVGYLPLEATHWFHGTHTNRRYADRLATLTKHQFSPTDHLVLSENGLWEWTAAAPDQMLVDTEFFFYNRREDQGLDEPQQKNFRPDSKRPSPKRVIIPSPKPSKHLAESYKTLQKSLRGLPPKPPVIHF